jgi:hypothetical protein
MLGDTTFEKLVESEAEEILGRALDGATAEAIDQFIKEVEMTDDAVKEILGEAAIRRRETHAARLILENVGGVAGGILPFGEGFEGAAAGGGDGVTGHGERKNSYSYSYLILILSGAARDVRFLSRSMR